MLERAPRRGVHHNSYMQSPLFARALHSKGGAYSEVEGVVLRGDDVMTHKLPPCGSGLRCHSSAGVARYCAAVAGSSSLTLPLHDSAPRAGARAAGRQGPQGPKGRGRVSSKEGQPPPDGGCVLSHTHSDDVHVPAVSFHKERSEEG